MCPMVSDLEDLYYTHILMDRNDLEWRSGMSKLHVAG